MSEELWKCPRCKCNNNGFDKPCETPGCTYPRRPATPGPGVYGRTPNWFRQMEELVKPSGDAHFLQLLGDHFLKLHALRLTDDSYDDTALYVAERLKKIAREGRS